MTRPITDFKFTEAEYAQFLAGEEIWRDIPEYKGLYQASNIGRIKSLSRYIKNPIHGIMKIKERMLHQFINPQGYYQVQIYNDGTKKSFPTHKLIAMAFLGHIPCGYELVINHINFTPTDNRIENLEIVTQRENGNLKHKIHSSKYTGVGWNKYHRKWRSYIEINGKFKHLGYFHFEEEAHEAYEKALDIVNSQKSN